MTYIAYMEQQYARNKTFLILEKHRYKHPLSLLAVAYK